SYRYTTRLHPSFASASCTRAPPASAPCRRTVITADASCPANLLHSRNRGGSSPRRSTRVHPREPLGRLLRTAPHRADPLGRRVDPHRLLDPPLRLPFARHRRLPWAASLLPEQPDRRGEPPLAGRARPERSAARPVHPLHRHERLRRDLPDREEQAVQV